MPPPRPFTFPTPAHRRIPMCREKSFRSTPSATAATTPRPQWSRVLTRFIRAPATEAGHNMPLHVTFVTRNTMNTKHLVVGLTFLFALLTADRSTAQANTFAEDF